MESDAYTNLIDSGSLGISCRFLQLRMESSSNLVNLIMLLGIVTILEPSICNSLNEGKESGFVKICDSIIFPSL